MFLLITIVNIVYGFVDQLEKTLIVCMVCNVLYCFYIDQLKKTLNDLKQLFVPPSANTALVVSSSAATVVSPSATNSLVVAPASTALVVNSAATELTYENYKRYRSQNPGPYSNQSFLRWVRYGGEDRQNFSWNNDTPNQSAEDYWRQGSRRGRRLYRKSVKNVFIF
ncbi:uncharacterized protein LOC105844517 isoform X2 [Hydra vulgaris]|uniref:uncharacterized protein LOC105844517 isoform X2 n=1 Tax=Hydra vulgaris TaxID=6087 RepID=UPI0032EA4EC7